MLKAMFRISGLLAVVLVGLILTSAIAGGEEPARGAGPGDEVSATRAVGIGLAAAFAIAFSVLGQVMQ